MMNVVEKMIELVEVAADGRMLNPLTCLDVMQDLGMYANLMMTMQHEGIKEAGGDAQQNQQRAEDAMLSSLAAIYVSFAGTFNQAGDRAALIAAIERQAIVFEHHRDEFVGQVLANIDNRK
jgi:hypothetical protein